MSKKFQNFQKLSKIVKNFKKFQKFQKFQKISKIILGILLSHITTSKVLQFIKADYLKRLKRLFNYLGMPFFLLTVFCQIWAV